MDRNEQKSHRKATFWPHSDENRMELTKGEGVEKSPEPIRRVGQVLTDYAMSTKKRNQ
jgi:hypothetical protein